MLRREKFPQKVEKMVKRIEEGDEKQKVFLDGQKALHFGVLPHLLRNRSSTPSPGRKNETAILEGH